MNLHLVPTHKITYKSAMKVRVLLLLVVGCLFPFERAIAQTESIPSGRFKSNIVFVEGMGNGFTLSLNYERIFYQRERRFASIRVGYSQLAKGYLGSLQGHMRIAPAELVVCVGSKHHFEYGVGLTSCMENNIYYNGEPDRVEHYFYFIPTIRLGYRYQKPDGHFLIRVGAVTAVFPLGPVPFPGIAIGGAF